jgi:hypothetical protein
VVSYIGFEVLTAVVMKSSTFWDIMSCSQLKVNRRFGGIGPLPLRGRRISKARNQCESRHYIPEDITVHKRVCSCQSLVTELFKTSASFLDISWQTASRHLGLYKLLQKEVHIELMAQ